MNRCTHNHAHARPQPEAANRCGDMNSRLAYSLTVGGLRMNLIFASVNSPWWHALKRELAIREAQQELPLNFAN